MNSAHYRFVVLFLQFVWCSETHKNVMSTFHTPRIAQRTLKMITRSLEYYWGTVIFICLMMRKRLHAKLCISIKALCSSFTTKTYLNIESKRNVLKTKWNSGSQDKQTEKVSPIKTVTRVICIKPALNDNILRVPVDQSKHLSNRTWSCGMLIDRSRYTLSQISTR